MNDSNDHFREERPLTLDEHPEQEGCFARVLKRTALGFLALIVIFSMLSNLLALPETINAPSHSDLGLTESEITERYGQPDGRSEIQTVTGEQPAGLAPRRLTKGESYYSLIYEEGPLTLVFHFVSPQIYQKYNAQRLDSEQWVVLERFIGTRSVVY